MRYLIVFLSFVCLLATTACEDVVELNLSDTEPKLVIEAPIYADTSVQEVRITRSLGFYETSEPPVVNDADVRVQDNLGSEYVFTYDENGSYTHASFKPAEGRDYTLTVVQGGQTYRASARLYPSVKLDSLVVEKGGGFGPPGSSSEDAFQVESHFLDPEGRGNYYRILYTKNGSRGSSDNLLIDDRLTDGQPLSVFPFTFTANTADTVSVELLCIEPAIYTYFTALSDISGANAAPLAPALAAPANPPGNLSGGAMGYFAVSQRSCKTIVIP